MNFQEVLVKLAAREDLTAEEATQALTTILDGDVPEAQIGAFLFGMRAKGETVTELTAFVRVMRAAAVPVQVDVEGAVDVCGTGGDHSGTFNISTAVAFVVAGAGVPVLKHGNRSISSKSGSFDVMEALGARVMLEKPDAERVYRETGITFLFAPIYHPAMKAVMPARRALGMRTFFNILGPLLNPAGVKRQVIGAYSRETALTMAEILARLEPEAAATVYAHDGLDELSTTSGNDVYEVAGRLLRAPYRLDAADFGLERVEPDALKGGDATANAAIMHALLAGKGTRAQSDIVVWNAAKAIRMAGRTADLHEALGQAREALATGAARRAFERFKEASLA